MSSASEYRTSHRYQQDEAEHLDLDIRSLVEKDPSQSNNLILEAFRNPSYSTRDFAPPERYPRAPENWGAQPEGEDQAGQFRRATSFADEMTHDNMKYSNGEPILDEAHFREQYGPQYYTSLYAAKAITETAEEKGKSEIREGLLADDEKRIYEGRRILQESTRTAREIRDNPEQCSMLGKAWLDMQWPDPESRPEKYQESSQAQIAYLRMVGEFVNDDKLAESIQHDIAHSMAKMDGIHAIGEIRWTITVATIEGEEEYLKEEHLKELNQLFYAEVEKTAEDLFSTENSYADKPIREYETYLRSNGEEEPDARQKMLDAKELLQAMVDSTRDTGIDSIFGNRRSVHDLATELEGMDTRDFQTFIQQNDMADRELDTSLYEQHQEYGTPYTAEEHLRIALTMRMMDHVLAAEMEMFRKEAEIGGSPEQAAAHYLTATMLREATQEENIRTMLENHRNREANSQTD